MYQILLALSYVKEHFEKLKLPKFKKKKKKKIIAILEILEKVDPDSTDSILDEIVSLIMTNITPNLAGTLLLVESFC